MCGRYYIDDAAVWEIRKFAEKWEVVTDSSLEDVFSLKGKNRIDIHPSEFGLVMWLQENSIRASQMKWGFPSDSKSGLLINARAESVLERPTFRPSFLQRRCVLPAAGFYEWNDKKEKNTFWNPKKPIIYLAGIYDLRENESRFVILTTQANEAMREVHDRMPLILEEQEVEIWIRDEESAEKLLGKSSFPLQKCQEYEQLTLFKK